MKTIYNKKSQANVISYIYNAKQELVYLELIGHELSIIDIKRIMEGTKARTADTALFCDSEFKINPVDDNGQVIVENLGKKMSFSIYAHDSVAGREFNIIYGEDKDDCLLSFKKWIRDINILPYPKTSSEDKGKDIEKYIFEFMIENNYFQEITTKNCIAYEIPKDFQNGNQLMKAAIVKSVKSIGVLKIDLLRDRLINEAPPIGDSEPELAEVFASFTISNNSIYYLIEYEKSTDNFFAFVKHIDDTEEWGEFNLEKTFNNKSIIFNELHNSFLDVDGNIINKEES